ncbi:hypothetical protein [Gracilinema caldarium]|uniref:Uncharacterized protein n=1 Tax=Gracilinema caldarium (strain ATCC 51460 / DSM 7334 / H1) TaxID=744872 RepID=F8F463_GRAC1|nr:hypothetical protein [Gracilinema caldarium]AEJ20510.1 hypothetical protein Spica_2400 [Gracilinema caldarium DSM 7334]
MTRGILIVGNTAPLTLALSQEAAKRLESHGLALLGNPEPDNPMQFPPPPATIPLIWTPGSSISARTLLISAENRFSRIDEVLLVLSPPTLRIRPDQIDTAHISPMIDDYLKGWYYLVRELFRYYRQRKEGTLALVLSEAPLVTEKEESPDMLGPVLGSAFRAFMQSVLATAVTNPFRILGFTVNDSSQHEDFAEFIFKVLDDDTKRDTGKLHRFGKLNLFR